MHFIEYLFGIAPDGGSGVLEFCLFSAPILITTLVVWRRRVSRKRRAGSQSDAPAEQVA